MNDEEHKDKYVMIAVLPETKRAFFDCKEEGERGSDDILRKLIDFFRGRKIDQMPV